MNKGQSSIHVTIDSELYEKVRNKLLDDRRDRIGYGKMKALIESLLQNWIEEGAI